MHGLLSPPRSSPSKPYRPHEIGLKSNQYTSRLAPLPEELAVTIRPTPAMVRVLGAAGENLVGDRRLSLGSHDVRAHDGIDDDHSLELRLATGDALDAASPAQKECPVLEERALDADPRWGCCDQGST